MRRADWGGAVAPGIADVIGDIGDLAIVQLAEGGAYVALGGAILKDAPQPNAARVWLNFMLGPKGQALLAEEGFKPAVEKYASAAPAEVVPLLTGKLMGTTTPGKLDETTKLATEIYKQ